MFFLNSKNTCVIETFNTMEINLFFLNVFTLSHPHAKQLPWLSSSNGNLLSSSLFRGREWLSAVLNTFKNPL